MVTLSDIRLVDRTGSADNEREQLNASLSAIRTALEDGITVDALQAEIDPTVPSWVKNITQSDIANWPSVDEDETVTGTWTFTSLQFDPATAPAHSEGLVWYDSTEKAISYYNEEADVTINLGQENVIRVRNSTGVTIPNGAAVYINGSAGASLPTVALADASALATAECLGLATHSIENNSNGYITTLGQVRDLDTSAFTAGDELFLSNTTPGGYVNSLPSSGYRVPIGYVTVANPANGEIKVTMHSEPLNATDIGNWDTAFSWGDHDGLYLLNAQDTLINDAGGAARFYFNSFNETLIFGGAGSAGIIKLYRDDAATDQIASFGSGVTFYKTTAVNAEFLNVNHNSANTTIQPDGATALSFGTTFDIDRHTGSGVYENVMSVSSGDVVFQNGLVYVKDVFVVDPASGSSEGGEIALRDTDSLDGFRIDVTGASSTTDERLRIRNVGSGNDFVMDRNGRIGIGTSSPAAKMEIAGSVVGAENLLRISNQAARSVTLQSSNAVNGTWSWNTNDSWEWNIDGTSALRIDTGGSVGIGTATPENSLHIAGDNEILFESLGTISSKDSTGVSRPMIGWNPANNVILGFGVQSGNDVRIAPGQSAKLTVKADGNVGIGTTSPTVPLDVVGDIKTSGVIQLPSGGGLDVRNANFLSFMDFDFPEITTENGRIRFFRGTNTIGEAALYLYQGNGAADLQHYINCNNGDVHLARNGGNVGIGTTGAAGKLEVSSGAEPQIVVRDAAGTAPTIHFRDSSNVFVGNIQASAGNMYFDARSTGGQLFFRTNGTTTALKIEADQDAVFTNSILANGNPVVEETEGTWTPVVYGSTTAGSHGYGSQAGQWRRHGDLMFVDCSVQITSYDATMAGNVRISGLPVAASVARSGVTFSTLQVGSATTLPAGFQQMTGYIVGSEVQLRYMDTAGVVQNYPAANTGVFLLIRFSAVYPV